MHFCCRWRSYALIIASTIVASFSQIDGTSQGVQKDLSAALVGQSFTLIRQPNHSGTLYLRFDTNDYICRIETGALFPLSSDLTGVKITAVTRTTETEVLRRAPPESAKGGDRATRNPGDLVAKSDWYRFSLRHEMVGRGNVLISSETGDIPSNINHIYALLGFVLRGDPFPAPKPFVASGPAKLAHYIASGHASVSSEARYFSSRDDVFASGFAVCPLCYNQLIRLPHLSTEIAIGKVVEAEIRHNHRILDSPDMQRRISKVAAEVLSNWPTTLKGYNYRFSVLDDGAVNALACPGGFIFVNRGLIDVIENDEELEAVLAHEIAHVEQRHGLMEYLKAKRDTRNAAIFASVITAGIAAGAAVSGNQDAIYIASAGGEVSLLLANLAARTAALGYSKQHEQEADIYALVYLQKRQKSKDALVSMLKKLRTNEDIETALRGEKISSATHPEFKERLHAAQTLEVKPFDREECFEAYGKDGDLLYSLALHTQAKYKMRDGRQSVLVLYHRAFHAWCRGCSLS